MKITGKIVFFVLASTVILSGLLFKDSFHNYFFQDDWFTLKIGNAGSPHDFFNFFIPRKDIIYYRPLGMQIPFFSLQKIFGINPLPFHILTFITHSFNIILVYFLAMCLVEKKFAALLLSFFYGLSPIHYTPFYWSSTYPFVLGPTAFFLSLIAFLRYLKTNKNSQFFLSLGIFTLGVFINEIILVYPLLLISYLILFNRQKLIQTIPYILISSIMIFIRFIFYPPTVSGSYNLGIGKFLISNIQAYTLWSFGFPEEIKAQFVHFWQINPQFIHDFPFYFYIFIGSFLINILFLIFIPLVSCTSLLKDKFFKKTLIFGIFWFFASLLPVIFFPAHSFSYYLPIPFVGLFIAITVLVSALIDKILRFNIFLAGLIILLNIINWSVISFTTVQFNDLTGRLLSRGENSRRLINESKRIYPNYPHQGVIFIKNTSENKAALNDQDAFRIIYGNANILTIYQ